MLRIFASIFLLALSSSLVEAKRIALVIGQSAYPGGPSSTIGLSPLDNPDNDADRVTSLLKRHGFAVLSCRPSDGACNNLNRRDMLAALAAFEGEANGAAVAVIYFAGHGMEAGGENVVAPIDARVDCRTRKVSRGIPVDQLIAAVSPAQQKLVIVDACRNNPLKAVCGAEKSGVPKPMGFAKIEPVNEHGLIVFTSAQFGQEALDGRPGGNSPFAASFISALESNPHIYFDQVFNIVAKSTHEMAAREQFPQVPSRVIGGAAPDTCLAGRDCVGDKRIAALYDTVAGLAQNLRTITDTDLASALRSGNIETLDVLRCDRTLAAKVASALRQPNVAAAFFRATRDVSGVAAKWLRKISSCGLDPNLLIPGAAGEPVSLLSFALEAGNVDAAVALLDAGATPHQYQGLWGERTLAPTVLHPFAGLMNLSLTREERVRIASAMVNAGIIIPPSGIDGQVKQTEQVLAELAASGIKPRRATSICEPAHPKRCDRSLGFDWCRAVEQAPLSLLHKSGQGTSLVEESFKLLGFLGSYEDHGYFMTHYKLRWFSGLGLARVTKDLSTIELFAQIYGGAGLGICDELVDKRLGRPVRRVQRSSSLEVCWRRIVMRKVPGKSDFATGLDEPYTASYCGSK